MLSLTFLSRPEKAEKMYPVYIFLGFMLEATCKPENKNVDNDCVASLVKQVWWLKHTWEFLVTKRVSSTRVLSLTCFSIIYFKAEQRLVKLSLSLSFKPLLTAVGTENFLTTHEETDYIPADFPCYHFLSLSLSLSFPRQFLAPKKPSWSTMTIPASEWHRWHAFAINMHGENE